MGQWASKPFDLRPQGLISSPQTYPWDVRTYECISCGNRLSEHQLDDAGGLCPKDGVIMRPLGHVEQRHSMVAGRR